ncbi:fimbrial protein [Hafnia alvei]|mgnify:CR=1 FL=1|uniref:Pilin (Type 1 fimbria component protein) n=1 Tax=Hafnia alvei TaxID=569 RepID=A0A1C6Z1V0_HAFAL|nr:fimbrial protein [Hafnia alvei]NLS52105.1 fimbrial protein [Hafnia alvei]SCM53167.1 Pilin (type 1 fimbria component protein) [Hafnia alvei]
MKNKWNIGFFILSSLLPYAGYANIVYNGSTPINIRGTILPSSCTIAKKSQAQSINLGSYANNTLTAVGKILTTRTLSISLTGCNDGIIGTVVTLTGDQDQDDNTLLALSNPEAEGTVKGLAIQIRDNADNTIPINSQSLQQKLVAGDSNVLTFKLAYKVTKLPVTVGDANSVLYLDLAYQ